MATHEELPELGAGITIVKAGERAYVVSVTGELDLYTTPRLAAELEAFAHDGPEVVVDLSGVTFIDSTGLGALLIATRRLREANGGMALVCTNESTKKLLELVGVDRVVRVFDSSSRALEHLVGSVVLRKLEDGA